MSPDDSSDDAMQRPLLRARGISKTFDTVEVLHRVDLELREGERHALLGENGAGKSTLLKIICGLVPPNEGSIEVDGAALPRGLQAAQEVGIALVHQELRLVPTLSVAENCFLGRLRTRYGVMRTRTMREATAAILDEIGLACDPATPVERLSFADRQLVEIARSLLREPRILALDEPTSALSSAEIQRLFDLLLRLNEERRTTIVFVSHRMPELYRLCTRATVMRDGAVVGQFELRDTDTESLVRSMVGREVDLLHRREATGRASSPDAPILRADDVSGPGVANASIAVSPGEVCGLGGLVGSGRTELARLLVGIERPYTGRISFEGRALRPGSVRDALRAGVGYVPEDRQRAGLALELTTGANAVVPSLEAQTRLGWLRRRALRTLARGVLEDSGVHPVAPSHLASSLSGGNQQKVVLGKWLPRAPRLLVLDEPTRGVDVNAKSLIHQRISALADEGVAVLLISSELPELLTMCDRIVVMREGRVVGEVAGSDISEESVIALASTETSHVGAVR